MIIKLPEKRINTFKKYASVIAKSDLTSFDCNVTAIY